MMEYDSPGSLVAAALQAKPSTRLGGSGSPGSGDLVHTYLERIDSNAKDLKGDIFELVKEKYEVFLPRFHDTSEMRAKVQRLASDMEHLVDGIQASTKPALQSAAQQQSKLKSRLDECDNHIALLSELLTIHEEFEGAQKDADCSNYLSSAKRLKEADEYLKKALPRGCEAQIYVSLKDELLRQRAELTSTFKAVWSQAFKFSVTAAKSSSPSLSSASRSHSSSSGRASLSPTPAAQGLKLELNSRLSVEGHDVNFSTVVQCLELCGVLQRCVREFCQKLLKHLLLPCVHENRIKASVSSSSRTITLCFAEVQNPAADPLARSVDVFSGLQLFLDGLHRYLSSWGDDIASSLCAKIGAVVWKELCGAIISKPLAEAVPSQASQMASYENVVTATRQFELSMLESGFVAEDCATMLQTYATNVNVHFASKKCEDLLVRARSLMTRDLHNTTLIEPRNNPVAMTQGHASSPSSTSSSLDDKRDAPDAVELSLAQGVLYMPRCRVSVFVQDLVQLARDTLQEATSATMDCAIQLFFSVRNVFELYALVVPTYHKQSVRDVPLLAALQHNNSFYLAHQLLTLGHEFRSQLQAKSLLNDAAAFVDLVPAIRKVGEDCLVLQLRRQHDDLMISLEGAQQFTSAHDSAHETKINRALRQVIHQLSQLARLWRDVLPKDVFLRSVGLLMDAVLNSVVSSVVSLEDISATEATALHTQLSFLQSELPQLLATMASESDGSSSSQSSSSSAAAASSSADLVPVTDEELAKFVTRWQKFKYLLTLLDAKMQTFVDLWRQGKGPLASVYSAAEIRRLIRALFQNTERREAALATIKSK